ncbi:MAG: hypothetical protein ABI406_04330 [Ktedonobacteraceae bacterium]
MPEQQHISEHHCSSFHQSSLIILLIIWYYGLEQLFNIHLEKSTHNALITSDAV